MIMTVVVKTQIANDCCCNCVILTLAKILCAVTIFVANSQMMTSSICNTLFSETFCR